MARRQAAAKTVLPGDSSDSSMAEQNTEEDSPAVSESLGSQLENKADSQHSSHEECRGTSSSRTSEQELISAGEKLESCTSKNSCTMEAQGNLVGPAPLSAAAAEPMETQGGDTSEGPIVRDSAGTSINSSGSGENLAKEKEIHPSSPTPHSADTTDSGFSEEADVATLAKSTADTATGKDTFPLPVHSPTAPSAASAASLKETPASEKVSVSKSAGTSPAFKPPFSCSCGRSFDTRRGLSIHLSHEPSHSAAKKPREEQCAGSQDIHSAPSSPAPHGPTSPRHSPSSTPSSPTPYSYKTSVRNPQYKRTRRGSNFSESVAPPGGVASAEIGAKRCRPSTLGTGGGPPPKSMHLNSGDVVAMLEEEEGTTEPPAAGGKKKPKESIESKSSSNSSSSKEITPGGRARVRSLSGGSDSTTSPPIAMLNKSRLSNVMQEFGLRSSPVTRSNAASLKTHEFISLPSRRKRGRRGGWRGGAWKGRGDAGKNSMCTEDNTSEVGEDFDTSGDIKMETDKTDDEKSFTQDTPTSPDKPLAQPPKRKRGRPPKIRRDTPSNSPSTSGAVVSKTSRSTPSPALISSSTRSGKSVGRGGGKSAVGSNRRTETASESPLPSKDVDSAGVKEEGEESCDGIAEDQVIKSPGVSTPVKAGSKASGKKEETLTASAPQTTPTSSSEVSEKRSSEKHFTGTRSRSKRAPATEEGGDGDTTTTTATTGRKKSGAGKVTRTPTKDASDAETQKSKSNVDSSDTRIGTGTNSPLAKQAGSGSPAKEPRSKSRSKKSTPKTHTPSKEKTETKKSVSELEDVESDSNNADSAKLAHAEAAGAEERKDMEDPIPPTAQIALAQQRQSVFVSVLSGSEKKDAGGGTADEAAGSSEGTGTGKEGVSSEKDATSQHNKDVQRRLSATSPVFPYSPAATPTPTYSQFSPYPGTFPPIPHMMYPPSAPPTSIYPPHFYGYPGTQHMQIPHPSSPHGAYFPPPPHMPSAPPQQAPPPSTTGDQTLPSPQNVRPQPVQFTTSSNNGQPFQQPQGSTNGDTPPASSAPVPTVTSTATTVGGVRVSVIDKPLTQLPMVTLPYHMPGASAPRPLRPQPGGYPIDMSPASRPARGYSGGQSPDGLEPRPPHIHPLNTVYRPGMMGPYPPHLLPPHPPYHHPMAVMAPFMDWAEPRAPPSEEHPVQPVECPECSRVFKNNKALNGHMRLHGGFDWTKKQPFTNADQAKQSSNGVATSTSSATKDHKDSDEAKLKTTPSSSSSSSSSNTKSVRNKKRSHSSSRSRSRSKSPVQSTGRANKSKRRKSSDDSAHSLLKGETKGGKETAARSSLPTPRAPSIFTFDTSSTQPHHGKPLCPAITTSASPSTATPSSSSDGQGTEGGGVLTHSGSTLDDLCRAAAVLERMDTSVPGTGKTAAPPTREGSGQRDDDDDSTKKRPGNINIPQTQTPSPAIERERHRLGATPPYTPPPILSPSRSIIHLAPGVAASQTHNPSPCTPSRILHHWDGYRRKVSETEDNYSEPRINVGPEFQAKLPECDVNRANITKDTMRASLLWKPLESLTQEDESVIDGFMELACSPAVLHGGRNKELASHYLHGLGGSIKEAVRWLLSGRSLFDAKSGMADYNYSGSNRWSGRERQQFRRAWKVHRKQFNMLRSSVESKKVCDVIEYYYTWKKYCSDEYRGRNRHISEEIFSDEDDITYPQVPSSSSSGSGDSEQSNSYSNDLDPTKAYKTSRAKKSSERPAASVAPPTSTAVSSSAVSATDSKLQALHTSLPHLANPQTRMFNNNLPVVYAPHSSPPTFNQHVHQFPCKYPGCNQVFTSIFALNGHIRIHGGSFFPKPTNGNSPNREGLSIVSTMSQISLPSSFPTVSRLPHSTSTHSLHYHQASTNKPHLHSKSFGELELAKALLELPGSHASVPRGMSYHTPSPKPSPGKGKILAGPKKKLSSSSPGEHEGYYPCNRCGRVFTKVKSRSAHMKSHVVKSN